MERELGARIQSGSASLLLQNETDVPDIEVMQALEKYYPDVARNDIATIDEWVNRSDKRNAGIVGQNKYVAPGKLFGQFKAASKAARDDDVVSNYLETTEQLAFKRVDLQSLASNEEEDSIWSQIQEEMQFEQKCRQIWREVGTISQCYVGVIWGTKDFKVKGLSETGKKSKKVFKSIKYPKKIIIIDPCKVLPYGTLTEELAYIANGSEISQFDDYLANGIKDDVVLPQWIESKYEGEQEEELRSLLNEVADESSSYGNAFYKLKPENVFRITSTKPDYQRFADVRLLSVFTWLDLKHNLQESDRADILGNLNAIIVVRRGDKDTKVTPQALAQTAAQVQNSARLPIMVGDHTLDIEIISRDRNYTLLAEKYNAIDSRVTARLYQALHTGNYAVGTATDNSAGLFKVIAASMEARRDDILDALRRNIVEKIYDKNDKLTGEPVIKTRRIALDFDSKWAQFVFDLFALDQVSHETVLAEVDLDLKEEVARKRREKQYSDVFKPPVPKQGTGDPKVDGRVQGGNNNGGGSNQESFNTDPKTPKDPAN